MLCVYSYRNTESCTPFMQAVCSRAYPVALFLLDVAKRLAVNEKGESNKELLMRMVYPPGSKLDNSPLYTVCCNDTCSFTWTGDEHINQVWKIKVNTAIYRPSALQTTFYRFLDLSFPCY